MKQLITALETIDRYNKMPFDEFVLLFENYYVVELSESQKQKFKFTGLANTDLIDVYKEL
jgi:hypothetical protein